MITKELKDRQDKFIEFGLYYHAGVIAAIMKGETVDIICGGGRTGFARYFENWFVRLFDENNIPELELIEKKHFCDDETIYTFKAKEN
ncbi:MAG TPA: hypothetical protein PLZ43_09280 [bacterium]|nr:hypothetical protein [bacterium]